MEDEDSLPRAGFRSDCWSTLLAELSNNEQLSDEATQTLNFLGQKLLISLTQKACSAAQRRESNTVSSEDVRFAAETIHESAQNPTEPAPLPGHQERMEMLREFRESHEKSFCV
jgi:histone H3/H4